MFESWKKNKTTANERSGTIRVLIPPRKTEITAYFMLLPAKAKVCPAFIFFFFLGFLVFCRNVLKVNPRVQIMADTMTASAANIKKV